MSSELIGIVIPTYKRPDALITCLEHLERQTWKQFQVVVVDDGSTDNTGVEIESYRKRTPLSLRYVKQKNSGPATARNLGISMLETPICLMLGDDIFPSPHLVEIHAQLHQQEPDIHVAGLGLTRWAAEGQTITPFMRWLDEAQIQFSYKELLAGTKPYWKHFYTSNLSVKTELLRKFTFDESFPYAAMEDLELAYQIEQQFGLTLRFLPDAIADHLHPTSFLQACKRMIKVGYSVKLFHTRWPEQTPPPSSFAKRHVRRMIAQNKTLLNIFTKAANAATERTCPNPLMRYALACYFEIGYHELPQNSRRR